MRRLRRRERHWPRNRHRELELNVNAACSEQQLHAEDASVITFAEGVRFDDVPEMMAASDLAVSGEVLNVQAGSVLAREVPAEPDAEVDVNQGFIPELVKVRVDEVFHHDRQHAVEAGDVITVQNYGWWADGHKPIEVTNYPTLCPGQDTFLFLTESALTPGRYVYVNSQGAYTVSGGEIRTGEVDDALVNELARLSPEALSEQARAASAAVSAGKVEAADDSAPVVSTPSAVPSG